MTKKTAESHWRDYLLPGVGLVVEGLAVTYGAQLLGYVGAVLLWLAVYEFTRSIRSTKLRKFLRISAAGALLLFSWKFARQPALNTETKPPVPPPTQTVLVRYSLAQLPLSVPAKTTDYVLQLHPKIASGIYQISNDGTDAMWWPRKPPTTKERPLGPIYKCEFTNYGDKALLDVTVVFDITFYSVVEAHSEYKKNKDGTVSLSATVPDKEIPGTPDVGVKKTVYATYWKGKTEAITPGEVVSKLSHEAVILAIPAGHSATIYLVNQSRMFAYFSFPTKGNSIVVGDPTRQPMILIRPALDVLDASPNFVLLPSTYEWTGIPPD